VDEERLARDALRAFDARLAEEGVKASYAAAQARVVALIEELENAGGNAELIRRLEVAVGGLENPESYANLVVELSREVEAIRNAGVPPALWEQELYLTTDELRAAAKLVGITEQNSGEYLVLRKVLEDADFFTTITSNRVGFIDLAFTQDDHGILTHALQDWIINRALAQEGLGTALELRALLREAVAPATWKDPGGLSIGARVWAEMWDSMGAPGAMPGEQGMYSPEFLTRMLKKDFPGISKPPRMAGTPAPAE